MRSPIDNFIPDRSRPGLTTAATGTVDTSRVPVETMLLMTKKTKRQRRKAGRRIQRLRERRKAKSVEVRAATLNVGSMTGKGRELADMI